MEQTTLKIGDEFVTYDEFENARKKHELTTFTNLVTANSRKLDLGSMVSQDDVNNLRYKSVVLKCKYFGNPNSTATQREARSYKCNCPYRMDLTCVINAENKRVLKITSLNDVHENHTPNAESYFTLPRQRNTSIKQANDLLKTSEKVRGNTRLTQHAINSSENRAGGKVIAKDIHNERARIRRNEEADTQQVDDLTALIEEMEKIEGATVKIVTEDQHVEGIYFQDPTMKKMFAAFPEIIFVDATYRVNDRNMPLQVVMVADGDGETQIVALFIIKSENVVVMKKLFEIFCNENSNCDKIETVMVDKHASNLATFIAAFPNAKINLCVFHVKQIFLREVTTKKRKISNEVQKEALSILSKMVYCKSEIEYDQLYQQLEGIASAELMEYFNNQWNTPEIKPMWVGFYVNSGSHFHNRSNNRTETFNQKLKALLTRFAPLKKMFKETIIVLSTLADERDYRKITNAEKNPAIIVNEQPFEHDYRKLLTHFAFTHMKPQINRIDAVQFSIVEDDRAFIFMDNQIFIEVTERNCTCEFFKTMRLPCKHIMALRSHNGHNQFEPALCHPRWHKSTISKFAVSEVNAGTIGQIIPIPINPRALTKNEKYRKVSAVLNSITDNVIDLPQALFETYLLELGKCLDFITKKTIFSGKIKTKLKY